MTTDDLTTHAPQMEIVDDAPPRAYVAIIGGRGPSVVDLPEGRPVSIGRSRSSGIHIDDRSVSRLHATLQWDGASTVTLTDRGSRNGTMLDGRRIEHPVELRSGAEVRVGDVSLVVVIRGRSDDDGAAEKARSALVARDAAMLKVIAVAERAARTDTTVLLVGETGVGKEVIARHVHACSPRAGGPFVAINCGAMAESLAESMLFGHEKGAFTGASSRHRGVFEQANGGTLLLDEVGELSPAMQVRLLRVLQEREVLRVGGTRPVPLDVRLIAATNANLTERVEAGTFRQDLLFRLDVMRVEIPPLRQRPDDIMALARCFLAEVCANGTPASFDQSAIDRLRRHRWPGNARELRNVIERAAALCEGPAITASDLGDIDDAALDSGTGSLRHSVGDAERDAIVRALELCGGNQTHAARRLGISRRSLIYKMERHGLKPPPKKRS